MKFLKKIDKKNFAKLFLIILIPNILRQVLYYLTFIKTNSIDFIASFETKIIYSTFPFIGMFEEILIGIVLTFFWFNFDKLRFFTYGWIHDALFDFISVFSWFLFGFTPLQALGLGMISRFIIREILISYVILGPLAYKLRLNIKKFSLIYSGIGLLVILVVVFS